jgi:hypothetical protein
MAIGVLLRNQSTLTNLLQWVYTPGDVNFRHYRMPDQFVEQFGPTKEDYQKVIDYAKSNHLEILRGYRNRGAVDVAGNAGDIERMFHVNGGNHPGTDFRNAYVPGVNNLKGSGQTVGLVELVGYNEGDVTKCESLEKLPNTPLPPIVLPWASNTPCVGCSDNDNREVAPDIEMVIAMAPDLADVMIVISVTDGDARADCFSMFLRCRRSDQWIAKFGDDRELFDKGGKDRIVDDQPRCRVVRRNSMEFEHWIYRNRIGDPILSKGSQCPAEGKSLFPPNVSLKIIHLDDRIPMRRESY